MTDATTVAACPECAIEPDACECRKCPQCTLVAQECECARCPSCSKIETVCACAPCSLCGRTTFECYVRVDERFPDAAREAYGRGGHRFAYTCDRGLDIDTRRVAGADALPWCMDRVLRHSEWTGPLVINGLEIKGGYTSHQRADMRREDATKLQRAAEAR